MKNIVKVIENGVRVVEISHKFSGMVHV